MNLKFSGKSLNECLEKASFKLNVSKDDLNYKITKEEKKFLKKIIEIEVLEENLLEADEREMDSVENKENSIIKDDFGIKVENGKITVKESYNNEIITVKSCDGVNLIINGQKCEGITKVTSQDNIEYTFLDKSEPKRSIEILISKDKMEVYVDIKYMPAHVYELMDQEYKKNLVLKKKKIEDKYPPTYTESELKELLISKGIKYGILEKELENICSEYTSESRLIAKGTPAIDDVPEKIRVLFKEVEEIINYKDTEEKVDYRKRFLIANVKAGDIIGEIIPEEIGKDGQDVFGAIIKRKTSKRVTIKIGEGCKLESNKVIATEEGKPTFKSNTFMINKLYKVDQVDLKSGNIDFVGNVEVAGSVLESMEVKAGNELNVGKNVESANLKSLGDITILGNIINSTVRSGAENVEKKQYLSNLRKLENIINELMISTKQIKDTNLLGSKRDGEVIKILIENKFKSLPKICRTILNYNMSEGIQHSDIITFIINKLLGLGPLKIEDISEFMFFKDMLTEEISEMEDMIVLPTNIYLAYAQGSNIESSGNVFITGKGQYTCNIVALDKIEFLNEKSVCRGGILSARNEIKLKTVGSMAGVNTILKVSESGKIIADIAYSNTIFCFGEKQIILETSAKDVKGYLNKNGEIAIDKFKL